MEQTSGTADRGTTLFIGVEEAATRLGISRGLAYKLVRCYLETGVGPIAALRLGGRRIVVPAAAIDALARGEFRLGREDSGSAA